VTSFPLVSLTYLLQNYCLQEKKSQKAPTPEEFQALKLEFLAMNKKLFEASFRMKDNLAQSAKGQPSLDSEDTGTQWKNDKK
jgi:hypothetical protein